MTHQILCGTIPLTNAQRRLLYRRRLDQWKLNQWHKALFEHERVADHSYLPERVSHLLIRQGH